jgi:hypothetical protein
MRGSCSRAVGRAGARRGEVLRAAERQVGVKSGRVEGEGWVKGGGVKGEGRLSEV